MFDELKLSIIVPCYNVENYLTHCVNSLLTQDLDKRFYEIIIVDDGSTDGTGYLCDELSRRSNNIIIIHQENNGLGAARNIALDIAKGKYVFFVDSDDYILPNRLGEMINVAENNDLDVLTFKSMDVSPDDLEPNIPKIKGYDLNVTSGYEYMSKFQFQGPVWWYITKRTLIESNGLKFPVNHFLEDTQFTPEVILSAKRIAMLSLVCYCYVNRKESIMRNKDYNHQLKMLDDYTFSCFLMDKVIKKHREFLDNSALSRLDARRNSFIYFGLIRALKLGVLNKYYNNIKIAGYFPLDRLDERDYPGMKWKLMRIIFNKPVLTKSLSGIIRAFVN